jgi:peptide/nickel transport system permease protein
VTSHTESTNAAPAGRARVRAALRQLLMSSSAITGAILLGLFVVMALAGPLLAPYDPRAQHLADRLTPPAWSDGGDPRYLLGTDQLGRDVLSRLLYGARVALAVGLFGTSLALAIGVLLGLVSGYFGGWWDTAIMRLLEIIISVPNTILYLTILGAFGPSIWLLITVIGLFGWTTSARVVRGEVLALRSREYVEASRALGQRPRVILFKHIFPNVLGPIVVVGTLKVASIIILEASLSFLGFGVQPPAVTWGQMLADGRRFVTSAWWLATLPGLSITLLTLSLLFLGNWLRDVFDPRTYD